VEKTVDDYQELRELALEDYAETAEPAPRPALTELAGGWWRGLGSLQKGFLIGLVLLNLILVTVGVMLLLQTIAAGAFPLRAAAATPAPTSVLPYPRKGIARRLPIGLKAATPDGAWDQRGRRLRRRSTLDRHSDGAKNLKRCSRRSYLAYVGPEDEQPG
jgi:hypothetical protein